MRYRDLFESRLPADFQYSRWGYWIEPDGRFVPVQLHGHYRVHAIGWNTYASGRIRVTAVDESLRATTQSGLRVLAADFFVHFVTKAALRSLMALVNEFEFDVYHICGLSYQAEPDMHWPEDMSIEAFDAKRTDSRSCSNLTTRQGAIAAIRTFLATARDTPLS